MFCRPIICSVRAVRNVISQLVCDVTRLGSTGHGSVSDLVLCNDPFIMHNVQVCAPFSTSDHCIVDFDVTILNDDKQTTNWYKYNFKSADWDAIKYHLSTVNWYDIFSSCSCPEQYLSLIHI